MGKGNGWGSVRTVKDGCKVKTKYGKNLRVNTTITFSIKYHKSYYNPPKINLYKSLYNTWYLQAIRS